MTEDARTAALAALLDEIHACLVAGRLTELSPLADGLEALAAAGPPFPSGALEGLRTRARRNTVCLSAVARGLRSARRRLKELAAAADGGSVYDGAGKARALSPADSRVATRL